MARSLGRLALGCLTLLWGLVTAACPAAAQDDRAALQREFESLFQRTLADPTDLDAAFRYAEVATRLGDYEAAITALERMLFFNPNLPRVRLELGVLYFRLGSFALARRYFDQAIAGPDVPIEVRARVATYLAEIDRLDSRTRFAGQAFLGIQYQSNANASPASTRVRALGSDATLSDQFAKKADQNVFGVVNMLYAIDLGTQAHDALEFTATAYDSKFFRVHRLDLGLVEGTVGPRFGIGAPQGGQTFRPYALANHVELGRNPFFDTYGGGAELNLPMLPWLLVKPIYEHRFKNYKDAGDRPDSRQLTGTDDIVSVTVSAAMGAHLVTLNLTGIRESTRVDFDSNRDYGGAATYQLSYNAPLGLGDVPWQSAAAIGRFYTNYRAPDPLIDPDVTRFDRRWRFGFTQTFGLSGALEIVLQLQRDIVSSTLPNFAYTNSLVLLGSQFRF